MYTAKAPPKARQSRIAIAGEGRTVQHPSPAADRDDMTSLPRILGLFTSLVAVAALSACGSHASGTDSPAGADKHAPMPTDVASEPMPSYRVELVMFGYPVGVNPAEAGDTESCAAGVEGEDASLSLGGEVQVLQGNEIVDYSTLEGGRWKLAKCTFTIDFEAHPTGMAPEFVLPDGLTYPIEQGEFGQEPSIRYVY